MSHDSSGLRPKVSKTIVGEAGKDENEKKLDDDSREKLKEELLRQFEAGQLKTEQKVRGRNHAGPSALDIQTLLSDYKMLGERAPQPRQIPTIEEQREKAALANKHVLLSSRPSAPLPDLSRPPPGYVCPVQVPPYQPVPQPVFRYEDNIVHRVLQSLMGNQVQQQVQVDYQDLLNKARGWDREAELKSGEALRSLEGSDRSIRSLEALRGGSTKRETEKSKTKRQRSVSIVSVFRPKKNKFQKKKKHV